MRSNVEVMFTLKLIEDKHMTIFSHISIKYVPRSWRERLFTKLYGRKWNPLVSQRLIVYSVSIPDPDVFQMGDKVVGHPETIKKLKSLLENQQSPPIDAKWGKYL